MRVFPGILLLMSLAGCALSTSRQDASSTDQALVARFENAIFDAIIEDAVAELSTADPALHAAVLEHHARLARGSVDPERLTPRNLGQFALLTSTDITGSGTTASREEIRAALDAVLGGLSFDDAMAQWSMHCQAPASAADDIIQARLNDISNLVFDVEPVLSSISSVAPHSDLEIRHFDGSPEDYARFDAGIHVGVFEIDLTKAPACEVPALTYMNTIPGKLVIPQSPLSVAVKPHQFMDGWALYQLSLLDAREVFTTEQTRAGRLRIEARVLSDALTGNTTGAAAAAEGLVVFKRLRLAAMDTLGSAFSEKAFHDRILALGPVPLSFVERYISQWLAARASGRIDDTISPGD